MNDILNEIKTAETRIRPFILKTPLIKSNYLSKLSNANVYLKLENEQLTGSFKIRGATNKLMSLTDKERNAGFVTASTGNHGHAVARASNILGIKGIIFLPENADSSKVEAIKDYDIELKYHGTNSVDTELFAKNYAKENNMTWVSPYNDPTVIGGQGTIGVELVDQLDHIDSVLVNVGGGGLISGISTYLDSASPNTKIVGCLPENSPEMYLSVKENKFVTVEEKETLSDGSAGGFEEGSITFEICKNLIDEYILTTEDEIKDAIRLIVEKHHKIIEGAAGSAVAAFIKEKDMFKGENVVIVLCGANISLKKLEWILKI